MICKKIHKLFEKYRYKLHAWKIKRNIGTKYNLREEAEYQCQVTDYHLRFQSSCMCNPQSLYSWMKAFASKEKKLNNVLHVSNRNII